MRSQGSSRDDTRIILKAGDRKTALGIRLTPTGAITGRVTDSEGNPVESASVSAMGGRGGGSGMTDDKGQFRIGGLPPGRYNVLAAHGDIFGGRPEIRTDGTAEVHNAATYYPGVLAEKEAGKVLVRAGDETASIDIQLTRVPFVRVSGRVVGIPKNAEEATIMISQGDGGTGTRLRSDGAFETWRLDPGKYILSGEWIAPNGDRVRTVGVDVEVAGSNIDNIELRVVADSDISGRLEFEDDEARQIPAQSAPGESTPERMVSLNALNGDSDVQPVPIDAGGTFHLKKVPAGKYVVNAAWGTSYIKSTRLGAGVNDGNILDLRNGSGGSDLSLLMSAATGSVSGVVQTSGEGREGTMVVLTAAAEETIFGARYAMPGVDGAYTIDGLPPGSYILVAVPESSAIQGNTVPGYEDQMETVQVGAREKVTKDLKRRSSATE